jgi:HEAT repeat protein
MIPYKDIIETADRRWTSQLLDRLAAPDLDDDELDELVAALQAVSDPRSVATLEIVLLDLARPAKRREGASAVLGGMQYATNDVPEKKLRKWWEEGDDVLRRHALSCIDAVDCPDIILRVAADPSHELHAAAIGKMMFFFDLPEHQQLKIAALSHPDPKVREAGATVLLWDEPVRGEGPLIKATFDAIPEVVAEAANTLKYYPSLRVIRRLHELLGHADDKIREAVVESYESIRNVILVPLCGGDRRIAEHIKRWLRPVWDILAFSDEELLPDEEQTAPSRHAEVKKAEVKKAMPVPGLLALLIDPDASPRILSDKLWCNAWEVYDEGERRQLRPMLLTHPDQVVRERAAWAFAAWQDAVGLLELVRDSHFCVRKSAMYQLGQIEPRPDISDLAWDYLHRQEVLGVHATETLATFVRHADPAIAVPRLSWIAGDHGRREELRVAAVHHLANLGAVAEMGQLAGLLAEPPPVTWALQLALLDAIPKLELPRPTLGNLRDVDNLYVQAALGRIDADSGGRR